MLGVGRRFPGGLHLGEKLPSSQLFQVRPRAIHSLRLISESLVTNYPNQLFRKFPSPGGEKGRAEWDFCPASKRPTVERKEAFPFPPFPVNRDAELETLMSQKYLWTPFHLGEFFLIIGSHFLSIVLIMFPLKGSSLFFGFELKKRKDRLHSNPVSVAAWWLKLNSRFFRPYCGWGIETKRETQNPLYRSRRWPQTRLREWHFIKTHTVLTVHQPRCINALKYKAISKVQG